MGVVPHVTPTRGQYLRVLLLLVPVLALAVYGVGEMRCAAHAHEQLRNSASHGNESHDNRVLDNDENQGNECNVLNVNWMEASWLEIGVAMQAVVTVAILLLSE